MDHFLRDLRLGFRSLRKNAGFTIAAILTLGLGIGVSTALFSVVYGVWLNAYPYTRADEILYPRARANDGEFADSQNGVFLQREFQEMARLPAVAAAAAFTLGDSVTLVGDHGPELVPAFFVSGNTTSFLGERAPLGVRFNRRTSGRAAMAEAVAVLSFNLWQRMFGGAADVVGRTVSERCAAPHHRRHGTPVWLG